VLLQLFFHIGPVRNSFIDALARAPNDDEHRLLRRIGIVLAAMQGDGVERQQILDVCRLLWPACHVQEEAQLGINEAFIAIYTVCQPQFKALGLPGLQDTFGVHLTSTLECPSGHRSVEHNVHHWIATPQHGNIAVPTVQQLLDDYLSAQRQRTARCQRCDARVPNPMAVLEAPAVLLFEPTRALGAPVRIHDDFLVLALHDGWTVRYRLTAVLSHLGPSAVAGHWVGRFRSRDDSGRWQFRSDNHPVGELVTAAVLQHLDGNLFVYERVSDRTPPGFLHVGTVVAMANTPNVRLGVVSRVPQSGSTYEIEAEGGQLVIGRDTVVAFVAVGAQPPPQPPQQPQQAPVATRQSGRISNRRAAQLQAEQARATRESSERDAQARELEAQVRGLAKAQR